MLPILLIAIAFAASVVYRRPRPRLGALAAPVALAIALTLPGLAFADGAPGAAGVNPLVAMLIQHALPVVLSGLSLGAALICAPLVPKAHAWVKAHIHNQRLATFADAVIDIADKQVEAVGQTTVDSAKAAAADGKLPKDIAKAALDTALAGIKNDMGPALMKEGETLLGDRAAVENLIKSAIEAAVAARKKEPTSTTATLVPTPPPAPEPREVVTLPGGRKVVAVGEESIATLKAHAADLAAQSAAPAPA